MKQCIRDAEQIIPEYMPMVESLRCVFDMSHTDSVNFTGFLRAEFE